MKFPCSKSAVVYLRVSTARQGHSGLGLDAQAAAVSSHTTANGLSLVGEFIEVESGKNNDRPQLGAALAACRLYRATLIIAKLDRLARNVAFIAGIMDSGVDFVACDMPHANRLTLHLMAAMAEHEATAISERTKAALEAGKTRGVKLGNPNGAAHLHAACKEASAASANVRKALCISRRAALEPSFKSLIAEGFTGMSSQARELNRRGVPAPRGGLWHPEQVRRATRST